MALAISTTEAEYVSVRKAYLFDVPENNFLDWEVVVEGITIRIALEEKNVPSGSINVGSTSVKLDHLYSKKRVGFLKRRKSLSLNGVKVGEVTSSAIPIGSEIDRSASSSVMQVGVSSGRERFFHTEYGIRLHDFAPKIGPRPLHVLIHGGIPWNKNRPGSQVSLAFEALTGAFTGLRSLIMMENRTNGIVGRSVLSFLYRKHRVLCGPGFTFLLTLGGEVLSTSEEIPGWIVLVLTLGNQRFVTVIMNFGFVSMILRSDLVEISDLWDEDLLCHVQRIVVLKVVKQTMLSSKLSLVISGTTMDPRNTRWVLQAL
ncbi:hypothetical protein Tco_0024524 [Tanacetum coccineum]